MDDAYSRNRKHLAQADRHIAEAKAHIAWQREVIQQLTRDGHEADLAENMLHIFEHTLASFEHHRRIILERLNMPE